MRAAQAFSIVALLGSALAAPAWDDWTQGKEVSKPEDKTDYVKPEVENKVVYQNNDDVTVVTVYETVTVKGNKQQQTEAPKSDYGNKPAQPQQQDQPWLAKPKDKGDSGNKAPVANDGSWQGVVAEWRSKMGLAPMTPNAQLEANALKTAQDGNGNMVHQLLDGSMGQVLAPGEPNEFEKVFVGGWLCEMPNASGMGGVCDSMSAGWAYDGQTGHAEILRDTYKNIGCACAGGIWACDVN